MGFLIKTLLQNMKIMNSSYPPVIISNYFQKLSRNENLDYSVIKSNKITQIAHSFYLALEDRPLINEKIICWKHGPILPNLYLDSRKVSKHINGSLIIMNYLPTQFGYFEFNDELRSFLSKIWEIYSDFTDIQLMNLLNCDNSIWGQYRIAYGKNYHMMCIDNHDIRMFYKTKIEEYRKLNERH